LREKYEIEEGDTILYVDVGDHIAILPVPENPLKTLKELQIEEKKSAYELRKEALKTAQKLVERKCK
jgi:bifunctional DNA-binding transcriptional regulator/antitoxin component of YhaV-PrlF toxin-antitoxin module